MSDNAVWSLAEFANKEFGIKLKLGLSFPKINTPDGPLIRERKGRENTEEVVRFIEMFVCLVTRGNHTITEKMTEGRRW